MYIFLITINCNLLTTGFKISRYPGVENIQSNFIFLNNKLSILFIKMQIQIKSCDNAKIFMKNIKK